MTTQQKNYRLPSHTIKQLEALIEKMGATETQIIILAVDRLAQQEIKPAKKST